MKDLVKKNILDLVPSATLAINEKSKELVKSGKKIYHFPSSLQDQIKVKPVYKKFNGWLSNTSGIKKWKNLPKNAQIYIKFIKNYCGVKISSISTSPKREDTILLENPFKKIN